MQEVREEQDVGAEMRKMIWNIVNAECTGLQLSTDASSISRTQVTDDLALEDVTVEIENLLNSFEETVNFLRDELIEKETERRRLRVKAAKKMRKK